MVRNYACALASTCLLFGASAGLAQRPDVEIPDAPEIITKLFDCRDIEDPDERLACFDREVDNVQAAQESKELVIADREQVKETRRGLFGFTLPKIGLFGGGGDDDDDEIKEVTETIARVGRTGRGRLLFELENGARWAQTDSTDILRDPKKGDEVTIRRASLGSFLAKIGGSRSFRVKRQN